VHFCFCQNFINFLWILIIFLYVDGKMTEIVSYIRIFHLTWLMSLHYLVKGKCSIFLPNTGFVTIRLLRFGVKVKRADCRDNFLAQRPLPNMRKLSGDDFLCFNRTTPRHISTRQYTISATLPSTYQNLLKLVEIWRSSNRNKNAQFFWDTVYMAIQTQYKETKSDSAD